MMHEWRAATAVTFGTPSGVEACADQRETVAVAAHMRSDRHAAVVALRRCGTRPAAVRATHGVDDLVADCDLMRTPTKVRLAPRRGTTIVDDVSSVVHALEARLGERTGGVAG